jgi:probable rRNA maturation factor
VPVALHVDSPARRYLPSGAAARLRARSRRALLAAGVRPATLSIVLVDDAAIRALNRDFRGRDRPTDVLSFSQREGAWVPGQALLGDVVVSAQTAARRRQRELEDELFFLVVHGLCHLLGHDHGTRAEARRMFALERSIRARADRVRTAPGRSGRSSPPRRRGTARRPAAPARPRTR